MAHPQQPTETGSPEVDENSTPNERGNMVGGNQASGSSTTTASSTTAMISQEQFRELLTQMTTIFAQQISAQQVPPPVPILNANGSYAKCAARYSGHKDESVVAFIDAISVYKECVNVSDENAIKGLPMLLTAKAAIWWQGVKPTIKTWEEAIESLRHAFGQKQPPYKIYRELFSSEQDMRTPTDVFVSQARALLAQLPEPAFPEQVQLDMVYGLLHLRIRKQVTREKVSTFSQLLEQARSVEATLQENDPGDDQTRTSTSVDISNNKKSANRCAFCRSYGHSKDVCRKLQARKAPAAPIQNFAPKTSAEFSPLRCYGCGAPGVIRSNCAVCSKPDASAASFEFCALGDAEVIVPVACNRLRPALKINVLGFEGIALIDTAAKQSVAGYKLYERLRQKGQAFSRCEMTISYADGHPRPTQVLLTTVDVLLGNRAINTTFIILPQSTSNRTLLGIDFLQAADLIIDIPVWRWAFKGDLLTWHPLRHEVDALPTVTDLSSLDLRDQEGAYLNKQEKVQLNALLAANKDVFAMRGDPTDFAEHAINTGDHAPIFAPPYKMPAGKKTILKEELDKLLQDQVIEECESPWAAPVILVAKKDSGVRVCVDYRRLNAVTVSDKYPLPRIDEILHDAKQSACMSTIDLRSGYHQVRIRECDRDKTGFITPFGTYRFLRMPFGLKNAPSTFQRLVDRFRAGLTNVRIFAYLDDMVLLSDSVSQHMEDLGRVFARLRQFKLRAKREKCQFARGSVRYLGHVITPSGISADPDKISSIINMSPPRTVKHVKSFLQTCSWYRRFIPNFADVARPISELTKQTAQWTWEEPQQEAFCTLKRLLTTAPILRQADERLPYTLRTDASSYALGAVLVQGEGPDERPVEYASRLLTAPEKNYSTTEREALAVVWGVNKFRGYIEGSEVKVASDHQPLRWLMSLKSPSGRLARWALLLQPYNLNITYAPGRVNLVADTLSRPPCTDETENSCGLCTVTVELPVRSAAEIRAEQLSDPDVKKIIDAFESKSPDTEFAKWTDRGYILDSGVLYRYVPEEAAEEAQLVVPECGRKRVLEEYHDAPTAGHYGVDRTLARISSRYYWPGMRRYVTEHIRACVDCQRYKPANLKPAGLLQTPAYAQRFEVLAVDLFGPLPETPAGERWILIVEDTSTKWVELFALKEATSDACAHTLIAEVFLRYGMPRKVISDNGSQFIASAMQKALFCLGIKQQLIPLYHPEANPVERKNRDLKTQLGILVRDSHTGWACKLPAVRFAMNSAITATTAHSPAYLMFAREPRTADDVNRDLRAIVTRENFIAEITPYLLRVADTLKETRDVVERSQDKRAEAANQKRRHVEAYKVGDAVLVKTHVLSKADKGVTAKLAPRRDGPYLISRVVSPTSYEIANTAAPNKSIGKYHTSQITPFFGDLGQHPQHPIRGRGRPPTTVDDKQVPTRRRGRPRKKATN